MTWRKIRRWEILKNAEISLILIKICKVFRNHPIAEALSRWFRHKKMLMMIGILIMITQMMSLMKQITKARVRRTMIWTWMKPYNSKLRLLRRGRTCRFLERVSSRRRNRVPICRLIWLLTS